MKPEILQEIVRALQLHGASLDYIATVGSWGGHSSGRPCARLASDFERSKRKIRTSLKPVRIPPKPTLTLKSEIVSPRCSVKVDFRATLAFAASLAYLSHTGPDFDTSSVSGHHKARLADPEPGFYRHFALYTVNNVTRPAVMQGNALLGLVIMKPESHFNR
jgi:hypothetical protein